MMASHEDIVEIINEHQPRLLEILKHDEEFYSTLVSKKVITPVDAGDIKGMAKRSDALAEVLDIVRKGSPAYYNRFLAALLATNQQQAWSLLSGVPYTGGIEGAMKRLKSYYIMSFKSSPNRQDRGRTIISLEEHYVETSLLDYGRQANREEGDIEELFEDDLFKKYKRVLIEGKSGVGKTTLIQKYAYDWSNGKGQEFIKNLKLFIICNVRYIEDMSVESAISQTLDPFDPDGGNVLYEFYRNNRESCLVVFEAVDEASDDTQVKINTYVEKTMSGLPIVMTGRHETFKESLAHFEGLVVRSGLNERQMLMYFQKTFPGQREEIKRMLLAETITPQLLESPYNCQEIGKLLVQGHAVLKKGREGPLTVTDLMVSIIESKLQFLKIQENHPYMKGIAKLALWCTMHDKVSFQMDDLEKFGITDEKFQNEFLRQSGVMRYAKWTFVHEMIREYLAASAVVDLQADRDHFYRVLCSKLKYSGIVRFICGLVQGKEDFKKILAHTKLLGEVTDLEYAQKQDILPPSTEKVKEATKGLRYTDNSLQSPFRVSWGPALWMLNVLTAFIGNVYNWFHPMELYYKRECQRFLQGNLTEEEKKSILGETNGIQSIPGPIQETFLQMYQCLHESSFNGNRDCDIVRKLIGDGLELDNDHRRLYALPVEDDRWLQMAISKSTRIAWITAHTILDAKQGLKKLIEYDGDVSTLVVCVPGKFQRHIWGRPDFDTVRPIQDELGHFRLQELQFRLESPEVLINALPDSLDGTELCLFSYSIQDESVWKRFLDDIVARPLKAFTLSFYRSTSYMTDDGFLKAFKQHPLTGSVIQEFRVMSSSLDIGTAIDFLEHCKKRKVNFVFDRTKFTGISSIDEVVKLLDAAESELGNALVAVSLEQAPRGQCQFPADSCCEALFRNWTMCEATDATKELYFRTIQFANGILGPEFYLPRCSAKERYENQEQCQRIVELFLKTVGISKVKPTLITPPDMEFPRQLVLEAVED